MIVCMGFLCLPNNSSNTCLSSFFAISPIDTSGWLVLLVSVSSNVVLFTKKSGAWKITSDGLSNLKPFGNFGSFSALATISSAIENLYEVIYINGPDGLDKLRDIEEKDRKDIKYDEEKLKLKKIKDFNKEYLVNGELF